jgi:hypothetical protein
VTRAAAEIKTHDVSVVVEDNRKQNSSMDEEIVALQKTNYVGPHSLIFKCELTYFVVGNRATTAKLQFYQTN